MNVRLTMALLLLLQTSSVLAFEWADLWFTPDQQGQRLMDKGEYQKAAGKFTTPDGIGAALFLAGDFEKAASVFGRSASAEAHYNRGNANIMLRKQAMARPDDDHGGTGGMLEADEFVFDLKAGENKSSGEQVIDAADQQLGEDAMRAMWLRKVETRPADFLAVRFSYQLAIRESKATEEGAQVDDD